MKRFRSLLLLMLIIAVFVPVAVFADYWGSKKSTKYHYTSCRWAQKIKPENLITFKTAQEAHRAGYVPCKVCRP